MSGALGWRTTGLLWADERAFLDWAGPGPARRSALEVGAELALRVGADRRCVGVWRSGRRLACALSSAVAATARGGQCEPCRQLARSNSVATDTRLDDPRPYRVYLAHHGSAGIKVGITGVERGSSRLWEQGALASLFLSEGRLAPARRVENLLGAALGLPDRISTTRKRAARTRPAPAADRARELLDTAARAATLPWPDGQTREPSPATDHSPVYGLPATGLRPDAAVTELAPSAVLTGRVACRIGPDLYLATTAGLVLLDTRLLAGWSLERAPVDTPCTAPLTPLPPLEHTEDQEALF